MSNNRAAINQQLFGQLSSIYTQLGQPIPNRGPGDQGGGGAYTAWLQSAISTGQGLLDQKRLTDLAEQLNHRNHLNLSKHRLKSVVRTVPVLVRRAEHVVAVVQHVVVVVT